jgi:amidohydrolase
MEIFAD